MVKLFLPPISLYSLALISLSRLLDVQANTASISEELARD